MRDLSDTLRSTFRRVLRLENRRAVPRPGTLEHMPPFESASLDNSRQVVVYLPPGYAERPEQRYPVLYMHDGQNLFEPERAFIPGQHWQLREAADAAIDQRTAQPMIIVGIDNAGVARIDEYTPTRVEEKGGGGRASAHTQMVISELKPLIDARFRTLTDPANTAIGGSSLGGLSTLYAALRHPDVFGGAAVMSPSVWWGDRVILGDVDAFKAPAKPRIWLDIGGKEGAEAISGVRALKSRLEQRGWNDANFRFFEDPRGDHSERAWAKRARMILEFLFPPREL